MRTPTTPSPEANTNQQGFTLAELVVATTLMSIALIGVYTTFHSTVLHWRNGSANEKTFSDARRLFSMMQHDLSGIPNDRFHLDAGGYFAGTWDSLSFVSSIRPMNVEDLAVEWLYAVRYSLNSNSLVREERPVEGPLTRPYTGMGTARSQVPLRVGRSYERVVADDVLDVHFTYLWTPQSRTQRDAAPVWAQLIERPTATNRLPAGVRIELTLHDPAARSQMAYFVKTITFDGEIRSIPDDLDPNGDA